MLQRFVGLNTKARPPICCAVARSAADKRAHVRIYCFVVGTLLLRLLSAAACLLALPPTNTTRHTAAADDDRSREMGVLLVVLETLWWCVRETDVSMTRRLIGREWGSRLADWP